MLFQAERLSEVDNGPINDWDFGATNNKEALKTWFKTYFAPYIKYSESDYVEDNDATYPKIFIQLANGVMISFWNNSPVNDPNTKNIHIVVYFKEPGKARVGKDVFVFMIGKTPSARHSIFENHPIRPYDYPINGTDRNVWTSDTTFGCNKDGNKMDCTGLIMQDGWEIKDDYPW